MLLLALLISQPSLTFVPSPDAGLYRLANMLKDRSAVVSDAQRGMEVAGAVAAQSELYANPRLILSTGNIAIPPTNPPDLRLLDQVMNYGAALSYTIEINKRGYRIARDRLAAAAAKSDMAGTMRTEALGLARALAAVAVAQLRIEAMSAIIPELEKATGLAAVELARLSQLRVGYEAERTAALAQCAAYLAVRCAPFASAADARKFLAGWITGSVDGTQYAQMSVEGRWDVRGLDQRIASQKEATGLADATWIPDPTITFGYVHDRFTAGLNNMNRFDIALSLPIPVFDRGQAAGQGARANVNRLTDMRVRLVAGAAERVSLLRDALEAHKRRQTAIAGDLLPKATAALKEQTGALETLFARRAVTDLVLAESDSLRDAFATMLDLLAELGEGREK